MSRIIIYNTKLSPELNAQVDNIQDYLNSLQATLDKDVQYQKVELDLSIKVDLPQEYQTRTIGNYVDLIQDNKHFYFFIMDAAWTAQNTVTLQLSLDTINTFKGDFTFTAKTHVIREHRNRFNTLESFHVGDNVLVEVVDNVDEGISGAVQYKVLDKIVESGNEFTNQKWYLVYTSSNDADVNTGNPISVELVPEHSIPIITNAGTYSVDLNQLDDSEYYVLPRDNNTYTTINYGPNSWRFGMRIEGGIIVGCYYKKQSSQLYLYLIIQNTVSGERTTYPLTGRNTATFTNVSKYRKGIPSSLADTDLYALPRYDYDFESYLASQTRNIGDVNRTDANLVKIIELPYSPIDFTYNAEGIIQVPQNWAIDTDTGKIHPTKYDVELEKEILTNEDLGIAHVATFRTQNQVDNVVYNLHKSLAGYPDPKLKHSAFYTYKVSYDSYSLPIIFENITPAFIIDENNLPSINISYKQSNQVSSTLGFKLDFNKCTYSSVGDYDTYLISNRSLESTILNNAYINYMKTGYNYDKKAKETSNTTTWISAGLQLVGAIGAFAASGATGGLSAIAAISLTSSAIATFSTAISNTINNEQNIRSKIDELKNQSTQVGGCDDLNLLNWYNGNKLHIMKYQASSKLRDMLNDLFYYCGYATNSYKIPNTTSRIWFNYIQCEPVFNEEQTSVYKDFLNDIKSRYSTGVTIFHKFNNRWNIEQTYENWERVLIV